MTDDGDPAEAEAMDSAAAPAPEGEARRQALHATMTLWIAALPYLDRTGALGLAAAAVVLNWLVFPATGIDRRLRRADSPFVDGIKLYPVAVLLLLLLLPLSAAAAGWAVMGVGDAASNVFGRRFGKPGLFGRTDRSVVGSVAFVAAGASAAAIAAWWASTTDATATLHALDALVVGVAAAVAGAVAELIPLPRWLDDNLPIAVAAGAAALLAG